MATENWNQNRNLNIWEKRVYTNGSQFDDIEELTDENQLALDFIEVQLQEEFLSLPFK